jgi:hypothetical protein
MNCAKSETICPFTNDKGQDHQNIAEDKLRDKKDTRWAKARTPPSNCNTLQNSKDEMPRARILSQSVTYSSRRHWPPQTGSQNSSFRNTEHARFRPFELNGLAEQNLRGLWNEGAHTELVRRLLFFRVPLGSAWCGLHEPSPLISQRDGKIHAFAGASGAESWSA